MIVTLFPDFAARTASARDLDLPAIRDLVLATSAPTKAALPWLKLARFGDTRTASGSLRHNANVISITGIEGDYDGEILGADEAAGILFGASVASLIYSSPSHTPEKPRWRVLCPLAQDAPPEMRYELIGRLNHVLGGVLSTESFTLSQAYYYGFPPGAHPETYIVAGRPIDTVGLPTRYPDRTRTESLILPAAVVGQSPDERTTAVLNAALGAFDVLSQSRHDTILATTSALAPYVLSGHLTPDDVVQQISAACTASGREPNPGEVGGALSGALSVSSPYVPATGEEFDELPPLPGPPPRMLEITEDHAARMLAEGSRRRFRYDYSLKEWFQFRPDGWTADPTGRVVDECRRFLEAQRAQWGLEDKEAMKAAGASFINNTVSLARSDALLATTSAEWDLDLYALGVPGGSVDLRTGEHTPADSNKLMRRRTSVAPAAGPHPVWSKFLHEATGGDAELEAWLHRFAGYVLTGDMSEEMLAFVYGTGKNGKGVFLGVLANILGAYAYQAPSALFDANSRTNREYQLAKLEGVRLLMVSETEAGSMLAEAFVKEITGNEGPVNARHPYGRPFTYRLQAKVLIVGNHAPKLSGRAEAMERRLRVVPFNNKPPVQDHTLKERLVAEYPQILQWMIEGCATWQADRLRSCDAIRSASTAYFAEQDTIALWIAERCDTSNPGARGAAGTLLEDYNSWLRGRGDPPVNSREFKEFMTARNMVQRRYTAGLVYEGLQLQPSMGGMLD